MRQITLTRYEVGTAEMVQGIDGRYDKIYNAHGELEAVTCNKAAARRFLKEQGVEVPRGTEVYFVPKSRVRYYFELDDLLAVAKEVHELPLSETAAE